MSIMTSIKKCRECYKGDQCALTLIMREYCKGPYDDRQENIQAPENVLNIGMSVMKGQAH